ncbi:hypothetical protein [Sinomonas halotolerans]|uniref:Uncharacterized protein n=1 Tax=Sinomonas halotolerans TaxID=1644133 RepID=A0ABU9WX28_9MICC
MVITTDMNAFYQGHVEHQHEEDIYPGFTFKKGNQDITVAAQNWDAAGQAIFNNGCRVVVVTPPPTTIPPTTIPPTTNPPTTPPGQGATGPVTTPPVTPVTTPPGKKPVVVPPAGGGQGAGQGGQGAGQGGLGAVGAAPSVSVVADTAAGDADDYTVSAALAGSGALMLAWAALTRYARRQQGQHEA